jgi:hypothetical protein
MRNKRIPQAMTRASQFCPPRSRTAHPRAGSRICGQLTAALHSLIRASTAVRGLGMEARSTKQELTVHSCRKTARAFGGEVWRHAGRPSFTLQPWSGYRGTDATAASEVTYERP